MVNHPSIDDPNAYVFYRYHPNLAAAVIFIILFAVSTAIHTVQTIRQRAWFLIPLIVGGLFETIGYVGRALSSNNQWALGPYIIQTILLLVAPALFAASIYMILGRIILLLDAEQYSIIKKKWLTKIFVCGDVLSFLMQSGGGGIMAQKSLSSVRLGQKIILVGLFLQIFFFGFFIVVAVIFHQRVLPSRKQLSIPWQRHMTVLYLASALILVRSVFRVIEYIMGNDGFLLRNEAFLYVFDSMLMFGVVACFNVVHPGEIAKLRRVHGESNLILSQDDTQLSSLPTKGQRT